MAIITTVTGGVIVNVEVSGSKISRKAGYILLLERFGNDMGIQDPYLLLYHSDLYEDDEEFINDFSSQSPLPLTWKAIAHRLLESFRYWHSHLFHDNVLRAKTAKPAVAPRIVEEILM